MSDASDSPPPKFAKLLRSMGRKAAVKKPPEPCCGPNIHVAFRGVSDDRLYLSRNRSLAELKFFRPNGLRVFCAGCRKRLA